MATYMLIMRTSGAAQQPADLDMTAIIDAMGAYNEAMMNAGVLVGGEGLADPGDGAVVEFTDEAPVVTDGPYGETHELFNGFWLLQVATRDEAIEWARRAPLGPGNKLEVRRVTDESDFAEHADNEYLEKEKGWREEIAAKQSTTP